MKALIFDSGTLITLSMNCLLDVVRELKKGFDGKFLITKEVKSEIVDKPLTIKKYKLGALRLKSLIDDGTLEFPTSLNIDEKEITRLSNEILKSANEIFYSDNRSIHIIDTGEASILALNKLLKQRNINSLIAMDERTTRMLCEKPDNLKILLEHRLHKKIKQMKLGDDSFHNAKFVRSTELIYVAFKKGIIKNQSKEMLDAMLYGAKFKGAAISGDEIKEMEKMGY